MLSEQGHGALVACLELLARKSAVSGLEPGPSGSKLKPMTIDPPIFALPYDVMLYGKHIKYWIFIKIPNFFIPVSRMPYDIKQKSSLSGT